MGRHSKRQKITTQPIITTLIPPTHYPEPASTQTEYGAPASLLNGDTDEGGLLQVTYKTILASKVVDNLGLIHRSLVKETNNFEAIRINDEDYVTPELINELKAEITTLKESSGSRNYVTDEKVESLNSLLDNELLHKKLPDTYGTEVLKYYETEKPNVHLHVTTKDYEFVKNVIINGLKVDRFEDVKSPDLSEYSKNRHVESTEMETQDDTQSEKSSNHINEKQDIQPTQVEINENEQTKLLAPVESQQSQSIESQPIQDPNLVPPTEQATQNEPNPTEITSLSGPEQTSSIN